MSETTSQDTEILSLDDIIDSGNLTDYFVDKEIGTDGRSTYLSKIADRIVSGYRLDKESRREWENTIDEAMKIAKQVMEPKNFPWPKAANIKYPLITEASIDFASRIMPEIFPNDKIVKARIQGKDADGSKFLRAERISNAMSYQLLSSPDWKSGVDSLLHILPVVGTVFKKTYYSQIEKRVISEVCCPDQLVVNYNSKSLSTARRVTHVIKMSINDVIERQRKGLFNRHVDVEGLRPEGCDSSDDDFEITFLEQHCWWDFDEDGYKEPYVITVHESSLDVMRIVSRIDDVEYVKNPETDVQEVACISPQQYFTDFHFIRSPDGGFYSMGFGHLLLPLNKAINSVFNQLMDSGTLSVTSGGFLGKGLRMRNSEYRFKPYEWKVLDTASGTDIGKNVFPFPVKEPSATLYNLLTLLLQIGKDITSSTEAFNGDLSGNNVSSSVMNTMVEQSAKGMYTAINKRLFDSMASEYQKLYQLNYEFLSDKEYQELLDDELVKVKDDFNPDDCDVKPVADPTISSLAQRLQKVQVLMALRTADPRAVDEFALRGLQFDDNQIKTVLPPINPNQPPPAKDQKDLADAQAAMAKAENLKIQSQLMVNKTPLDLQITAKQLEQMDAQIQEGVARVWKMQKDAVHGDQKILIAGGKMKQQESLKQAVAEHEKEKSVAQFVQKEKELDLKGASAAADAVLENKKLDIMREKQDNDRDSGSE